MTKKKDGLLPGVVRAVPAKKNTGAGRGSKKTRTFFQAWVKTYFEFCKDKFGEDPSFDGSAPRDLGMIYDAVEKKCFEKEIEWTETMSLRSFKIFLEYAWNDSWLQENFMLFNLNRQKDKIFFRIKSTINGKSNSNTGKPKQFGSHKTAGQDIFADRLKGRIDKKFNASGG